MTQARAGRPPAGALPPLLAAAAVGHLQEAESLLAAGADVHAIEPTMGAAALHKAAQAGSADVLGLLLDHGAFVDQQSPVLGNTPLIDAVLHKHETAVGLLLGRGARTAIRNHWHQTALELARHDGLTAIAGLLEARDRDDADRMRAQTLIAAIEAGDADEAERLVAAGAPPDRPAPTVGGTDDACTPLGVAARTGSALIVRMLLRAGADPRGETGLMGGTPVHEAAYFGHSDVLRALTEDRGPADAPAPNIDAQGPYNGLTALHDAVWHGHQQAMRALVDAGARLDLRTDAGLTPRDLAVLYGYDDIARELADAEHARPAATTRPPDPRTTDQERPGS